MEHVLIDSETHILIEPYTQIQNCAKEVMAELVDFIRPGFTEKQIAEKTIESFRQRGVTDFWYYGIAALVLVGRRTPTSVSGRSYKPTDEAVKDNDIVTVDLSPQAGNIWGDYARTIYVHNGKPSFDPGSSDEYAQGDALEKALHGALLQVVNRDMSAHELWQKMNLMIVERGIENLDFKKNLGHSIEKGLDARSYIEEGNNRKLGDFGLLTFEPHIWL